jgi:hypothetical protein
LFSPRRQNRVSVAVANTPNRSLFREVNERIRDVNTAFHVEPSTYELICECHRCDCMTRIDVPREVYETVRTTPGRFLVASGHEHGDRLVAGAEAFSIVTFEREPSLEPLTATAAAEPA